MKRVIFCLMLVAGTVSAGILPEREEVIIRSVAVQEGYLRYRHVF